MTATRHSACTLSLALAMALAPRLAEAASHCQGLEEAICGQTTACRFQAERKVGDATRKGQPAKTGAKAHCRLDVRAAAAIAAKIQAERQQAAK
jgi:IS5 family transposase